MGVRKDSEVGWEREGWGMCNEMELVSPLFCFPSSALAGHLDLGENTDIP